MTYSDFEQIDIPMCKQANGNYKKIQCLYREMWFLHKDKFSNT